MKKITTLFLLIILSLFVLSANAADCISIGLKYDKTAVTECFLRNQGGFTIVCNSERITEISENEIKLVMSEYGGIDILNNDSNIPVYTYQPQEAPLEIMSNGSNIFFNNTEYRGDFHFLVSNNKITVINFLQIEEYLKSVVPAEMPGSWHIEALKAQAVCARNYALTNMNKYKKYGFNLDDTISSQVYKGISVEYPNSTRAVEETTGMILKHNGALVQTFFFSSSGGQTESVKNVWGSDISYLSSVSDPYEQISEWTVHYTPREIEEKLSAKSINIGNVTDLEIIERSDSGRVINLIIKGTIGEHILKLEAPRAFFNLRSNLYTIEKKSNGGGNREMITSSGSTSNINSMITSNGIINPNLSNIITSRGIEKNTSSDIAGYDFIGKGFGHGVGLSQYGAKGFAENGYTYEQILQHYYTGAYLE